MNAKMRVPCVLVHLGIVRLDHSSSTAHRHGEKREAVDATCREEKETKGAKKNNVTAVLVGNGGPSVHSPATNPWMGAYKRTAARAPLFANMLCWRHHRHGMVQLLVPGRPSPTYQVASPAVHPRSATSIRTRRTTRTSSRMEACSNQGKPGV